MAESNARPLLSMLNSWNLLCLYMLQTRDQMQSELQNYMLSTIGGRKLMHGTARSHT